MRVLCLLFPRLPIELTLRTRAALHGRPLVLLAGHGADALVTAASGELSARGLLSGMSASEARGRAPEALFAPDNSGACLEELERMAVILRARATPLVEIGGRDHVFIDITRLASGPRDEERLARRLASLTGAWSGFATRAGVASTRGSALEAARAARRVPQVYPALLETFEPAIAPYRPERLSASVLVDDGENELAVRAALHRLARKLDMILSARHASTRSAVVRTTNRQGDVRESTLRLREPQHQAGGIIDELTRAAHPAPGPLTIEVELGSLGPDVRVAPCAASRVRPDGANRRPQPQHLRRAG